MSLQDREVRPRARNNGRIVTSATERTITTTISGDVHESFDAEAKKRGLSKGAFMRRLIIAFAARPELLNAVLFAHEASHGG